MGTSAGAVVAALLGLGVSVADLSEHQRGRPLTDGPLAGFDFDYDRVAGGALPPVPRPGVGSVRLLARSALHLRSFPPLAVLSGLAPHGRSSLTQVGALIEPLDGYGTWPDGIRIVAMDYATGKRVPFGRRDAPPTPLSTAVMASCAIPGWFPPVTIAGRRYVDGGTCSMTNADVATGVELDRVYVLAPMAAHGLDHPSSPGARLERRVRRAVNGRLAHEIGKLEAGDTAVTVFAPGPDELTAMGANVMNPRPRRTVLETALRANVANL